MAPSMGGGGWRLECAGGGAGSAASGPSCIRPVSVPRQGRRPIASESRGICAPSQAGHCLFSDQPSCCAVSRKYASNQLAPSERRSVRAGGRTRTCIKGGELNPIAAAIAKSQYRPAYALGDPRAPRRLHSPAPAVCKAYFSSLREENQGVERGKAFLGKWVLTLVWYQTIIAMFKVRYHTFYQGAFYRYG